MSWRKTIKDGSAKSWRDTISDDSAKISDLESGAMGAAQSATLGWADELAAAGKSMFDDVKSVLTGEGEKGPEVIRDENGRVVNAKELVGSYLKNRDAVRQSFKAAEEANPGAYMTGEIGGAVASSMIPGLNVAKGASLASRAGIAAAGGALSGLGTSEAEDARGLAGDAAMGAALGAGLQGVGEKVVAPAIKGTAGLVDKGIQAANQKFGSKAAVAASKGAQFLAGVDEDAALRQIRRPWETAAAEADGFAFKVGQDAVQETAEKATLLGQNVNQAKDAFLGRAGAQVFPESQALAAQIEDVLRTHKPSPSGWSGLSDKQREKLLEIRNKLQRPQTGEDLVKIREHIDNVLGEFTQYDKEQKSLMSRIQQQLRGKSDQILDNAAPDVNAANTAFSQFADDRSLLRGSSNEGQAESMINNLFGRNKGMQQEAASRLFSPETFEKAKDIAANKAFDAASRPGGDNYFRRGALAVLTAGGSEVATNPDLWKKGLRGMGRVQQALQTNPQLLGKYAQPLAEAAKRGPKALAATHFILSQRDQEYRRIVDGAERDAK